MLSAERTFENCEAYLLIGMKFTQLQGVVHCRCFGYYLESRIAK